MPAPANRSMVALPALREAVGSVRAALASASLPTFTVISDYVIKRVEIRLMSKFEPIGVTEHKVPGHLEWMDGKYSPATPPKGRGWRSP